VNYNIMLRYCQEHNIPEWKNLTKGLDFRLPQYRREVFLHFYEFHLKYRSHAGGVYYFIPYLSEYFKWNIEQRLWFASINGLTQYAMTSLAIFQQIPVPPFSEEEFNKFNDWFNKNWKKLPFDSDRKYQKVQCPDAIKNLNELVKKYGSLQKLYTGSFSELWDRVRSEFYSLGRLGAWSGLEFVKLASKGVLDFSWDTLMLKDISGSKSHRNGLCIVLGRDELDWHDKLNTNFDGKYTEEQIEWLTKEGEILLNEAKERFKDKEFINDVGYETLETTLCCYKSWHRPNRRYPNVYNDMAYSRLIDTQEKNPFFDLTPFWEARKKYLPKELRIEDNPNHPQYKSKTLSKLLQNYYRETGNIHTMGIEWDCFHKNIY